MILSFEQAIFTKQVALLIQMIFNSGYLSTLGEAFRTYDQAVIYAHAHKGIINSLHCKHLAIDINVISVDGKYITDHNIYQKFGDYWESLDPKNRWGGYFVSKYGGHIVDSDHFERNVK